MVPPNTGISCNAPLRSGLVSFMPSLGGRSVQRPACLSQREADNRDTLVSPPDDDRRRQTSAARESGGDIYADVVERNFSPSFTRTNDCADDRSNNQAAAYEGDRRKPWIAPTLRTSLVAAPGRATGYDRKLVLRHASRSSRCARLGSAVVIGCR